MVAEVDFLHGGEVEVVEACVLPVGVDEEFLLGGELLGVLLPEAVAAIVGKGGAS